VRPGPRSPTEISGMASGFSCLRIVLRKSLWALFAASSECSQLMTCLAKAIFASRGFFADLLLHRAHGEVGEQRKIRFPLMHLEGHDFAEHAVGAAGGIEDGDVVFLDFDIFFDAVGTDEERRDDYGLAGFVGIGHQIAAY